jgi:cobalt-zinc-cadmium efflux system membrane fusion protein
VPLQVLVVGLAFAAVAATAMMLSRRGNDATESSAGFDISSQSRAPRRVVALTDAQWSALSVATVSEHVFRSRLVTDGKIAIDDDHATPVFSPFAGRAIRILARPGDKVAGGQVLCTIEVTDMVQAQNDFIAALTGLNKARSQLRLAEIVEKREHELYDGKASALKEWQQAQANLVGAENDVRSAEIALDAVSKRLRILGRTDREIEQFREQGRISPETPILAPIAGTVVQRKVGPGQYISQGASDPVFVIGDLATVWLLANVRESDAAKVKIGQTVEFKILADASRTFAGSIAYVAAAVDPNSRRLSVRAVIDNSDLALKPEMFASVAIQFTDEATSPAVPREALIYAGDSVRAWVALAERRAELRDVTPGLINGNLVQVVAGLGVGETVITGGNIFIDRVARGGAS